MYFGNNIDILSRPSRVLFTILFLTPFGRSSLLNGLFSNNSLWDDLYHGCGDRVSFHCVQSKFASYINSTLDSDFHVTDGIYFVKNGNAITRRTNDTDENEVYEPDPGDREFDNFIESVENVEQEFEGKSYDNASRKADDIVARGLHTVTDMLYEKTVDYLTSHDLKVDLPTTFFGGSKMTISPRSFDPDGGVVVKLNFDPGETARSGYIAKYFHKMFKKKLLSSFLALILIIKLIKIKLMYVLPLLIGVNAAKKLLLKTLLFLFPPLVHLFKLCTFYHAHAAKHYHHHKVKHHHHHIKVPVPVPVHVPVHSHKPYDLHSPHSPHDDYENIHGVIISDPDPTQAIEGYGGPDYYRNDMSNVAQHGDELDSWGLKDFYASTESPGVLSAHAQAYSPYAEHNYKKNPFSTGYKDSASSGSKKNKVTLTPWKTKNSLKNTLLAPYDPFYTPILQKIDGIFTQLGFNEEGCRERLTCSMYKNPVRFSPHSNLLSTELSRDPAELEKPSQSNLAALRFYKYVEAARDGQSQKDCLSLYPDCVVKTE